MVHIGLLPAGGQHIQMTFEFSSKSIGRFQELQASRGNDVPTSGLEIYNGASGPGVMLSQPYIVRFITRPDMHDRRRSGLLAFKEVGTATTDTNGSLMTG